MDSDNDMNFPSEGDGDQFYAYGDSELSQTNRIEDDLLNDTNASMVYEVYCQNQQEEAEREHGKNWIPNLAPGWKLLGVLY